jgi:hypothetical protein
MSKDLLILITIILKLKIVFAIDFYQNGLCIVSIICGTANL